MLGLGRRGVIMGLGGRVLLVLLWLLWLRGSEVFIFSDTLLLFDGSGYTNILYYQICIHCFSNMQQVMIYSSLTLHVLTQATLAV
jgi:hypothetical protein